MNKFSGRPCAAACCAVDAAVDEHEGSGPLCARSCESVRSSLYVLCLRAPSRQRVLEWSPLVVSRAHMCLAAARAGDPCALEYSCTSRRLPHAGGRSPKTACRPPVVLTRALPAAQPQQRGARRATSFHTVRAPHAHTNRNATNHTLTRRNTFESNITTHPSNER